MQIRIHFKLMPQFLNIPKVQLSLLLVLVYLSALVKYPNTNTAYILLASSAFCILFDLVFAYLRKRRLFIPFAAITSGLIITLLADINSKWYEIALICAVAMASKNFLRISGKHLFNPAGFGLLAGGLLLGLPVSWWGVSFQSLPPLRGPAVFSLQHLWPFLILISPALVSAYRMRRFVSILSFLVIYTTLSVDPTAFLDPTVLFFSLVMLPEPMTSPVDYKRQAIYGVLIASVAHLLSINGFIAGFLPDVLIPSLLLGNLLFFKFR